MDDKLLRQIVFVVLGIIAVLGVLALLQMLVQMIIPLAVIGIGSFAFYKLVLEGRDKPEAMADEVAESSGMVVEGVAETVESTRETETVEPTETVITPEETEKQAQERLSAVEKAQRDYVDNTTPAEEILDQIKQRKQRLQGDNE